MASERELRNRIRSVKNIGQVTRALEAVSASKVRKAQAQVLATRAYAVKAWEILVHVSSQVGASADMHPLLEVRTEPRSGAILLLTSDRGLCGAFNTNIVRKTIEFAKKSPWPTMLVTVGSKGRDLMYRAGQQIIADFTVPDPATMLDVTPIARTVMDLSLIHI